MHKTFTFSFFYDKIYVNHRRRKVMQILRFRVGDTLIMKKKHPCSSDKFRVLWVGSDVKITCLGCQRSLTLPRETVEKSIKKVVSSYPEEEKDGIN